MPNVNSYIPDFGVFGDYVCDYGSYADLGEAKSVCKDGLNFLECDIILELRERRKFIRSLQYTVNLTPAEPDYNFRLWKPTIFPRFNNITGSVTHELSLQN